MAGQGPSRRELLQALGLASAASLYPGFARWSYAMAKSAPQHSGGGPKHKHVQPLYRPQFFSAAQYRTVELLADLILPATPASHRAAGSGHRMQPGAKEAGVAEFIDFMAFSDAKLQAPFKEGLAWLDQASTPASSFGALAPSEQEALLNRLAYKAKYRDGEKPGQQFFQVFRKYTVIGFYTTHIGLQSLDYPGLTFYGTSPSCTHDGNPEHVGL